MEVDKELAAFLAAAKARTADVPVVQIVEGEAQIKAMLRTLDPIIAHASTILVAVILNPETQHLLLTDEGRATEIFRACRIAWEVQHGHDPEATATMEQQEVEECLTWAVAHNRSAENVAVSLVKHVRQLERECKGWFGRVNRKGMIRLDRFMTDVFGDFDPYNR